MTPSPSPARPADAPEARRIPAFHPVPVGARKDGWTPRRQAAFVGLLAQTGSVEAACRALGMAKHSVYRLRRRPGAAGFAAAWDAALGTLRPGVDLSCAKSTGLDADYRRRMGLLQVVMEGGRFAGTDWKDDENFPPSPPVCEACGRPVEGVTQPAEAPPAMPSHPSTPTVDFGDGGLTPLPLAPDGVPLWRSSPRMRAMVAAMGGD